MFGVISLVGNVRQLNGQVGIGFNGGKLFTQQAHLDIQANVFAKLAGDVLRICDNLLQTPVFLKQFDGGLGTHARNAWQVVRGVSHQPFQVRDQIRGYPHVRDHQRVIVGVQFTEAFFRNINRNVIIHELQQILVAREDFDLESFASCLFGERSNDVIGFQEWLFVLGNAQARDIVFRQRNLFDQFFGGFVSSRFVVLVFGMAKGLPFGIKGDQDVGEVSFQDTLQHVRKPKDHVGVLTFGVLH